MILFKKKNENIYLITNFKVMFTSLSSQSNLIRMPKKELYLSALKSWLLPSRQKYYFITRDPYDKIESFYKSKFLKAEENRLWMIDHEKDKNPW